MLILLPLTNLSAKIIHAEYGYAQVITPGRADWLTDVLHIDRVGARFTESEMAQVQSGLLLNVPHAIGQRIQLQGPQIGAIIHRLHIEQIARHMVACSTIKPLSATAGLQWYYNHYGLSDDDLNTESMYREYSRFKKKMFAKNAKKTQPNVRQDSRVWLADQQPAAKLNFETLDQFCLVLDQALVEARIRRRKVIGLHAHMYIYSVKGNRDIATIARRFRRHPANVYRALAHVRKRIKADERFSQAIRAVISPDFVLPPPP